MLVFTLATGFVHGSIPVGAKCFELMGKKTGAFETVASSDKEMFTADKLKEFDAVIMESTTGSLFGMKGGEPADQKAHNDELRKNLLDFVSGGKGIVGIHAASDCSYDWKEYGELIGGYFNGHPWGHIVMKIDDPKSPITACFDGKEFTIDDEIYTFKDPYSHDNLHILTSIDLEASKITGGENRKDHDYAVSWIHESGKGRVFYCSLGHRDETYWNPTILKEYLAGIQYALGDLKADATPSSKQTASAAQTGDASKK